MSNNNQSNDKNFDAFLTQSLGELNHDIAPKADLWRGIERAIDGQAPLETASKNTTTHSKVKYLAVAASLCAFALLVNVSLKSSVQVDPIIAMTNLYEAEKSALLVQYQAQPALTEDWQVQLAELESAEAAIKLALENDSRNPTLLRMLSQVYQQQLDLINRVHKPSLQHI